MNIYIPYTYLIGWSTHNKWYYGVRYKNGCHPDEFWVKYFTSSEIVKKFREQNGEPDVIQIRKTFPDRHKAALWEATVLDRIKDRSKWLNQRFGMIYRVAQRETKSDDHRKKLSLAKRGQKLSEEHKRKIRESCKGINTGRVCSEEKKRAISASNRGKHQNDNTPRDYDAWYKNVYEASLKRKGVPFPEAANPRCSCIICMKEVTTGSILRHYINHLNKGEISLRPNTM
jgi:hypothetical protein